MIRAEENPLNKENLVIAVMQLVDEDFQEIIKQAMVNLNYLRDPSVIRLLGFLIKVNERVCDSVGHFYFAYL